MTPPFTAVPERSADWYLDAVVLAASAPRAVQRLAEWFTLASPTVAVVVVVALAVWRRRDDRAVARLGLTLVSITLAWVLTQVAKPRWGVERPCRQYAVDVLLTCPSSATFPSSHAALGGAFAVGVALAVPRLAVPAVAFGLVVAAARVFVGVHYPHDTVAGFAVGAVVAAVLGLALTSPLMRVRQALTPG